MLLAPVPKPKSGRKPTSGGSFGACSSCQTEKGKMPHPDALEGKANCTSIRCCTPAAYSNSSSRYVTVWGSGSMSMDLQPETQRPNLQLPAAMGCIWEFRYLERGYRLFQLHSSPIACKVPDSTSKASA